MKLRKVLLRQAVLFDYRGCSDGLTELSWIPVSQNRPHRLFVDSLSQSLELRDQTYNWWPHVWMLLWDLASHLHSDLCKTISGVNHLFLLSHKWLRPDHSFQGAWMNYWQQKLAHFWFLALWRRTLAIHMTQLDLFCWLRRLQVLGGKDRPWKSTYVQSS